MRGFDLDAKPPVEKKKQKMEKEFRWFTYSSFSELALQDEPGAPSSAQPSRSHKKKVPAGGGGDTLREGSGRSGGGRKKKRRRKADEDEDEDDE